MTKKTKILKIISLEIVRLLAPNSKDNNLELKLLKEILTAKDEYTEELEKCIKSISSFNKINNWKFSDYYKKMSKQAINLLYDSPEFTSKEKQLLEKLYKIAEELHEKNSLKIKEIAKKDKITIKAYFKRQSKL